MNEIIAKLKDLKESLVIGTANGCIDKINEIIGICEQYVPPDPTISQEEFAALSAPNAPVSVYIASAVINVNPRPSQD